MNDKITLERRLTHRYNVGWSHLDDSDHVGTARLVSSHTKRNDGENHKILPPNDTEALQGRIADAIGSTKNGTKARRQALEAIKWQLVASDGRVAGLNELAHCVLVPADSPHAQVFDGRDDENMKSLTYQYATEEPLSLVLLP